MNRQSFQWFGVVALASGLLTAFTAGEALGRAIRLSSTQCQDNARVLSSGISCPATVCNDESDVCSKKKTFDGLIGGAHHKIYTCKCNLNFSDSCTPREDWLELDPGHWWLAGTYCDGPCPPDMSCEQKEGDTTCECVEIP